MGLPWSKALEQSCPCWRFLSSLWTGAELYPLWNGSGLAVGIPLGLPEFSFELSAVKSWRRRDGLRRAVTTTQATPLLKVS